MIDNNFHSFKLPFFGIALMTELVTVSGHVELSSDVWRSRLYEDVMTELVTVSGHVDLSSDVWRSRLYEALKREVIKVSVFTSLIQSSVHS